MQVARYLRMRSPKCFLCIIDRPPFLDTGLSQDTTSETFQTHAIICHVWDYLRHTPRGLHFDTFIGLSCIKNTFCHILICLIFLFLFVSVPANIQVVSAEVVCSGTVFDAVTKRARGVQVLQKNLSLIHE